MKINKIDISYFKGQESKNTFTTKNNFQKPYIATPYSKIPYKQGIQYWAEIHKPNVADFKDIETSVLKNNVLLNIDKNSPEDLIALRMLIKPIQEQNANPAVKMLYKKMLQNLDSIDSNSDNFATFYSENGKTIEISINWDKKDFSSILNKSIKDFIGLNIDEKTLEQEKELALQDLDLNQDNSAHNALYGIKNCSKEDIKNVSIADIKKFHNELLSNSAALCAISIPKGTDETTIVQIKDDIGNQIPNQKPFNDDILSKSLLPIEKEEVFYLEPNPESGKLISKTFNFQNGFSLKDKVISDLIGAALEEIIYENYSQSAKSLICSHNTDFLNKHFVTYIMADKNAQINEDMINSAIKSITEKPLDDKLFEKIKQRVLESRKENLKTSISRAELLEYKPTQSVTKNNEFSTILNSITSKELQQKAQMYLKTPSITEIRN